MFLEIKSGVARFGLIPALVVAVAVCVTATAHGDVYEGRFLERARAYADTMLEKGRDRWGVNTPLFVSKLDRRNHELTDALQASRKTWRHPDSGVLLVSAGGADGVVDSANVTDDNQLYTLLYRLSEVTGKRTYAEAADASLRYFWRNCQDPNTGLMAWGEHMGWHLPLDTWYVGPPFRLHEPRWFPHFERCYEMGGGVSGSIDRYARGVWRWQINNHEKMRWGRHPHVDEYPDSARQGREYPRLVGEFANVWSLAYARTDDRALKQEMHRALRLLVENVLRRRARTGAYPSGTGEGIRLEFWTTQNILMIDKLLTARRRVPEDLSGSMTRLIESARNVVVEKLDHPLTKERGYVKTALVETLEPGARPGRTGYFSTLWTQGWAGTAGTSVHLFEYARRTDDDGARRLAMKGARLYMNGEPDYPRQLTPGALAWAIEAMLRAYRISEEQRFLERARQFGDDAVDMFIDERSPLPKRVRGRGKIYETGRGNGDWLMLALFRLDRVLRGHEPRQEGLW